MKRLKKFLAQFALSLLFLAGSAIFLVLSKIKITGYMFQIQAYTAQVYALRDIATTSGGLEQLQNILEAINPIVWKATIYTYFIVPAVLLILWIALIGASFYLSFDKPKATYKRYILRFSALSIAPMLAAEYIALKILQSISDLFLAGIGLWKMILYLAILLLIAYFTFVAYTLAASVKLTEIVQKTTALSVKKIHVLLPLFLLFAVIILALLASTMSTYLNLFSNRLGISTAYNFAALFIALSAALIIKNFIIKTIIKRSRAL